MPVCGGREPERAARRFPPTGSRHREEVEFAAQVFWDSMRMNDTAAPGDMWGRRPVRAGVAESRSGPESSRGRVGA